MKISDRVFFDTNLTVPMSIGAISTKGNRVKCQWLNKDATYQEAWFEITQLRDYRHNKLS
jgi:uncharacterized protein YodC (DUF2158 family)